MKPSNVKFAQIDAKDDYYTGYDVAAFTCLDSDGGEMSMKDLGPTNGRLSILMRREYLVRLKQLQDEIAKKYLAQSVDEEVSMWESYDHSKVVEEAKVQFSGDEADYYD